ncbi:MAG: hypothetical protein K9L59_07345 [Desulfobacterales bacterium]|nr:hypothetical protein [Desulfobacterales bacterium]
MYPRIKFVNTILTVRVTLDISATLLKEIDAIRSSIGVDRSALIKVWLHERVQQEKSRPR